MAGRRGLVAVPTDSSYAVVARLDDKNAADRLRRLRGLDDRHHLTVLCRDLAEIGHFARSTTASTGCSRPPRPALDFHPGSHEGSAAACFASSRKTIGIRVPDHVVMLGLLEQTDGPLLSTTLIPKDESDALNDAEDIRARYDHELAAILDAGACPQSPTTVIDLTSDEPVVVRVGRGDPASLGLA